MSADPSAWRNFRKANTSVRRGVGRPRKSAALTPFYGYPAEIVAEVCAVKLSTAYAYKTGRLKPGASVLKLWRLHAGCHVMPEAWRADGWLFNKDSIVDPEGRETGRGLLRAYAEIVALAHTLARRTGDPRDVERVWELLKAA